MKPVQYFSDEYLEHCKKMTPLQIVGFLENYRNLLEKKEPSILISIKIPKTVLDDFKFRCKKNQVKYQTQIKQLMRDWLNSGKK